MKPFRIFNFFLFLFPGFFTQAQSVKQDPCKPVLLLNGYKSGDTISQQDLGTLNELVIFYPCEKTISRQIMSFMFTVIGGETRVGFAYSLTDKMKEALKHITTGKKIYIDNVTVKNNKKQIVKIAGLTLVVGAGSSSEKTKTDSSGNEGKIPSCSPLLLVGVHKDGESVTKNQLNLINKLSAYNTCNIGKKLNGCNVDIFYKIMSYEVSTTIAEKPYLLKCNFEDFPEEIKKLFRELKAPKKLRISNVIAKDQGGAEVKLPGVVLTITPAPEVNLKSTDYTKSKGHGGK